MAKGYGYWIRNISWLAKLIYGKFGRDSGFLTRNYNYEGDEMPYDSAYATKDVKIGDFVCLGIITGNRSWRSCHSSSRFGLHGKIPLYSIAWGNLAVLFKYSNQKHFKNLKKMKRFH